MTDTCPNCCQRAVKPRTQRTDSKQIRSAYRCPHCGHAWITNRLRTTYPAA
ncbi:zinc ribbon domain-containing protein [Streptomyces chartreusis]|uniref:hypothetical protein n=1 Tax=Streptomyces chartreusis TaxID=1969 RepID=UPI00382AC695